MLDYAAVYGVDTRGQATTWGTSFWRRQKCALNQVRKTRAGWDGPTEGRDYRGRHHHWLFQNVGDLAEIQG